MGLRALMEPLAAVRIVLLALLVAALPLAWWWLRQRGADSRTRLAALTALTLFLTFDLVVFGAFTRLSDSGLGCPDWPGCYGAASPIGAGHHIAAAEAAAPAGPVTWSKAWVEMIHRYLAMAVGVLIVALAAGRWAERRRPDAWSLATLAWVVVQGLFGRYTVTLKLYPAIVTAHLLGGLLLLALLAVQHAASQARPALPAAPPLRRLALLALAALAVQIALGGWVSTNVAVLACGDSFPGCNGQVWPSMDVAGGFTLLRELGRDGSGAAPLSREALVAIHMAHRLFAVVAAALLGLLAWRLARAPALRGYGRWLAALLLAQLASGLSNVVLGWPLVAALAHSAGAAALVLLLTRLLARTAPAAIAARRRAAMAAA